MSLSSRNWFRGLAATSAAVVFAVAGGAAAHADDVYNTLDTTIDTTVESTSVQQGASTSVSYVVKPDNGDGNNGCNIQGGESLVVDVTSSAPGVASVSPSTLTFTSCTPTVPPSVTVTGVGVGTATVSLSQASNNTGGSFLLTTATFAVNVTAPAKTKTTTTLTCPASTNFTGAALTPCSATVTGTGDFSQSLPVSYSANTLVGTASAAASFAGDATHLASQASTTFAITKAPSTTTITCPTSATWTGSPLTPCTAAVTGAGGLSQSLTPGYAANTAVGTATSSASFAGDANHVGSSDSKTFEITKAGSTVTVTCTGGPFTYTGSPQTPCSATVTGDGGLNETVPVSYVGNVNAGTATATAEFAGSATHSGSSGSEQFTIGQATSTVTVTCSEHVTYTGSALEPCTATATGAGNLSVDRTDSITYGTNTNAGTATASATYDGDPNHTGSTGNGSFTIDQAPSTVTVTCPAHITYTGSALEPCTATATGAGNLSVDLTDSITYGTNTNAGTATASATYDGDPNHTGSTGNGSFTIDQASSTVKVTCPTGPFYFTGTPITPACTATATGAGGLYVDVTPVTFSDNVKVGSGATASANYPGDDNHSSSTGSTTFTITGWRTGGFFQPVDMGGVWNTVKNGSTVPLKFELFAGTTEIVTTGAVGGFEVRPITCANGTLSEDDVEFTTTGGTSLRYDSTGGQFIQNWQTPKKPGNCYVVTMTARDGSTISANFKLK